MKCFRFVNLLAMMGLMLLTTQPALAKNDPMTLLKETQGKLQAILDKKLPKGDKKALKAQAQEVRKIIEPFFNFDRLSRQALGKHWKDRSDAEKKQYLFWLKALLKQAYIRNLNKGVDKKKANGTKIKYTKQKIGKKKATVFTKIKYRDPKKKRKRRVRIDWVFYKKKGAWMVGDIVTNDNSLAETYEEQFDKIITKKSFADLIRRLKKKVNQLRKKDGLDPLQGPGAGKKEEKPEKKGKK